MKDFSQVIYATGSQVLTSEMTWLKVNPFEEIREDILVKEWSLFLVLGSRKNFKEEIEYEVIDARLRRGWISSKFLILT